MQKQIDTDKLDHIEDGYRQDLRNLRKLRDKYTTQEYKNEHARINQALITIGRVRSCIK